MSLGFDINDIKDFLLLNGGRVGYHVLVKHFKHYLSQPNTQSMNYLLLLTII